MTTVNLEAKLEMFDLINFDLRKRVSEYDADGHLAVLYGLTMIPSERYAMAEEVTKFAEGIDVDMDARRLIAIKESPAMHSDMENYDEHLMKKEYASLCSYDAKLDSMIKKAEEYKENLLAVPKGLKIHGIPEFDKWFSETVQILDSYKAQLKVIMQTVDYAICSVRNELTKGDGFIQQSNNDTRGFTFDNDTF